MYVHYEKRIVFIAHPRTASSATAHVLMGMDFEQVKGHHVFEYEWFTGWDIFCTVRNPYDVMVSWFCNQPREKPFSLWLPQFLDECQYLRGARMFFGQASSSHVIRYENLQEEFDAVMDMVGLPHATIPHRNVSKREGRQYAGYYNFRTAGMVVNRFREDFLENDYKALVRLP
jgi:hypothetical protein